MKCPSRAGNESNNPKSVDQRITLINDNITIIATHAINPTVVSARFPGRKYILLDRETAADTEEITVFPKITQ